MFVAAAVLACMAMLPHWDNVGEKLRKTLANVRDNLLWLVAAGAFFMAIFIALNQFTDRRPVERRPATDAETDATALHEWPRL